MEISVDPIQCITAFLIVFVVLPVTLTVTVIILNGLFQLGNRIIRGPEQIEAVVLVIHPETIRKYALQSISTTSNEKYAVNFTILFSKLFSHSISDEMAERWIKSGKMSLFLYTEAGEISSEFAIKVALGRLQGKSFSKKTASKMKVYSIASTGTEKVLTA